MSHYVYKITNSLNGMIYVGKRSSKCSATDDPYFGSGVHLKRAIKKYGKENFMKEIIAIVDTAEEAEDLEEMIVDVEFIARKDTYNIALGGKGGNLGDEVNSKISKSKTGGHHTQETKDKLSKYFTGSTMPDHVKEIMRNIHIGNNHAAGHKHTQEFKDKQSNRMLGNTNATGMKHTEEFKEKMSRVQRLRKRKPFSVDTKMKMSERRKGTIWINNGTDEKRVSIDHDMTGWGRGRLKRGI